MPWSRSVCMPVGVFFIGLCFLRFVTVIVVLS